jgi:hypothetical protein
MPISDKLKVVCACIRGLRESGYDAFDTTDFEGAVAKLVAAGKTYLTPNMSPLANDFTKNNCFWLMLTYEGEVVGGIAARRDCLGDESLGSYWRRAMRRQYGQGEDQVQSVARFIDAEVRGDITYFGDLLVSKSHRGHGSHLRYFTMLAQMTACVKWDADWTYSFISEARAEAGGAYTYGFAKTIPGAQEWINAPKTRDSSECCVISSRTDLCDIATYFARSPDKLRVVQNAGSVVGKNDGGKGS